MPSLRDELRLHLARSVHWTPQGGALLQALSGGLALAVPMALGAVAGVVPAAILVAAGALFGSGSGTSWTGVPTAFLINAAAVLAGTALPHLGVLAAPGIVLLAGGAALLGGYSRQVAAATTRFVLVLVLAFNLAQHHGASPWLAGLLLAGALWGLLLPRLLTLAAAAFGKRPPGEPREAGPAYAAAQKWRRWRRLLGGRAAWSFPAALTAALAASECIAAVWPGGHGQWVALTVALVLRRGAGSVSLMTTQRVLGTLAGVVLAGLLQLPHPGAAGLVLLFALLGAARSLLAPRNYLLYSAAATPLIVFMLEGGSPPGAAALVERLAATLAGAALVLAVGPLQARLARP